MRRSKKLKMLGNRLKWDFRIICWEGKNRGAVAAKGVVLLRAAGHHDFIDIKKVHNLQS